MKTIEASTSTEITTAIAEQGANSAPRQTTSKKASRNTSKKTSKPAAKKPARKETKTAATKKPAKATDAQPREGSKKQVVLELLRRKDGATTAEIAKATGWQNHSIRGFISGALSKKMGLKVESKKNDAGERVYKLCG